MLLCLSADQCRACLEHTHAANTDATDFSHANPHVSSTCFTPALNRHQDAHAPASLSHAHTKRRSLLVFAICKCLYSFFPCHHLHHCYYNNYLPKTAPSSFAACLSAFTAVQATSLSLSPSLSFLSFFVQSPLLLLLQMLVSALQ